MISCATLYEVGNKKFLMILCCLACMLAGSLTVLAAAPEKILVEIPRTAEVTSPVIYLGEVARITAPDFFKEELARVDLGKSPRANGSRRL